MVTAEQMVEIAAPMIIRELESMLVDEMEACSPWSIDDELVTDGLSVGGDADQSVPLDDLLAVNRTSRATDELDDFFGTY